VDTIRAFFCLELDGKTRQAIGHLAGTIRDAVRMKASWVREPNYHITIRFLGDIDAISTVKLEQMSQAICKRLQPFDLALGQLGAFSSIERPRVLWIGDSESPTFRGLSTSLDVGLRSLGFPREHKDAVAHVTIARIKGRADPSMAQLVAASQPAEPIRVRIDRLTLMQSELTPSGAIYTPLFATKLAKAGIDGD